MFNRIAPVGSKISTKSVAPLPSLTENCNNSYYFQSGTEALASALILARERKSAEEKPEVIIPGYACPDIISAALYAGLLPVLIDMEPESPYMKLDEISDAINTKTAAIVAINFLGIPERIKNIRKLIKDQPITIVEDSAQWFPSKMNQPFISDEFSGDLVVLSFGKGKPVSLLGGGALIIREPNLFDDLELPKITPSSSFQSSVTKSTIKAYNALINPFFYWILEKNPFLSLGKTAFKKLSCIKPMDSYRAILLNSNIVNYQKNHNQIQEKIKRMLWEADIKYVIDLPKTASTYKKQRLLRYPILLKNKNSRNQLLQKLTERGIGASPLYKTSLPNIHGIKHNIIRFNYLENSEKLANRLITLPTHSHVKDSHLKFISDSIQQLHY
ncbi:DegT/DnrJ/EryC1/StrS family aminotransferase [Porticoccus sp. GXU_MW_L64]